MSAAKDGGNGAGGPPELGVRTKPAARQPRDFGFGSEEQMVRESASRWLRENAGIEILRKQVAQDHHAAYESAVQPAPWNEKQWQQVVELGWSALAVPEESGGAGMKMVAVAALAEEIGRAAWPSPLTSTLLATMVLRAAGGERAGVLLERIGEGGRVTLAHANVGGSFEPDDTEVKASTSGDTTTLDGTAWFVQDARKAEVFLVAARSSHGVGLYAVPADAPGVKVVPDRIVDLTRDQGRVELDGVRVDEEAVIAAPPAGAAAFHTALPAILTILAADLCGAGEWQLQTTTEYARVRTQFDHPIGFFQAVKHPIVNMMIELDRARSLVYAAACAIDTDPGDALRLARMAKAAASDAGVFASDRSVQLHGGIGFTWECDVHIYFKRQMHTVFLYGDGRQQRAELANALTPAREAR
jgi:alkylation response protein AidB-like acyl-CoA dehydrogenase